MRKCLAILLAMLLCLSAFPAMAEGSFVLAGYDDNTTSSGHTWETNLFFPRMEKITGVTVTTQQYSDTASWTKAKAAMLNGSQELPDALFKAALTPVETLELYQAGKLIDLRPYLAEYAPNLSALLTAHPEWEKAISLPDGAIAALPQINELQNNNAMWINRSWLDKLGLSMPTNTEELTDVLRAFRDLDPNGNGSHDEIFQQYHVKCIIGLFNPEIEGIPFISLEDIISMNSAEKLTNIFSEYLDEEQMEIFNQNLVKNFSLQNVVESITILNPDKLLDEVEQAVGRLQKITGRKIAGRIMIGLYVHLCCLVERLVTKTPIDNYQDLEEFEQKHADFIRQVRDSFQDISRHYRVTLPVSEIAYIYDYMHLNSKNKLSGQAESPAVREDE